MNKKIKIAIIVIIIIFLIMMIFIQERSKDGIDRIINYTTEVFPRSDGTLDIKYHIEWKVLDSKEQGPLEWVKIGIPNMHVDNIKKLSSNIKSIKHIQDGGEYVKIDFNGKYYSGETITFDFSIHQRYMYEIDNKKGKITYEFTPGWFNDIVVEQAVIKWKVQDVIKHNGKNNGEYIVWNKKLLKGQKINAKVEYTAGAFDVSVLEQATNQNNNKNTYISPRTVLIISLIILTIIIVIYMIIMPLSPNYYYWHSGYGYYPYYHHRHYYQDYHHGGGFGRRRLSVAAEEARVRVHVHAQAEEEQVALKKIFMELN